MSVPDSPPQCLILTLGDVSFDWLWFKLSPDEMKKRRVQQKKEGKPAFNWLNRLQVVTVALHGGAWYVDNFVRMLLGPSHVQIAYTYRRFHSHHLRHGEYTKIIHADTGYQLKKFVPCLPEKATPVKVVKSVYRACEGPTYFGPLDSTVPPAVEGGTWKDVRPGGAKNRAEAKHLKNLAKEAPDTFVTKALNIKHAYPTGISTILVLHDESNGFSRESGNWSHVLLPKGSPHSDVEVILLNLDLLQNLGKPPPDPGLPWIESGTEPSRLWHYLRENDYLERTIVITSADDLRRAGVRISKSLSWERTAQDFLVQVRKHPDLGELCRAGELIVRFGLSGVIHYSQRRSPNYCRLYYHPDYLEGEYRRPDHGQMFGYNAVITATLATELLQAFTDKGVAGAIPTNLFEKSLDKSVPRGLANCRAYFRHGLGDHAVDLHERLEQEWDHIGGPADIRDGKQAHPFPPELTDLAVFPFNRDRSDQKHVFVFEMTVAERRPWKSHFYPESDRPQGILDKRRTGGELVYLESVIEELARAIETKLKDGLGSSCVVQRGDSSMAGKLVIDMVLAVATRPDHWTEFADKVSGLLTSGERRAARRRAKETLKKEQEASEERGESLPDGLDAQIRAWAMANEWVSKVYDQENQKIDWYFGWPICIHAFADDYKSIAHVDVPESDPDWRIIASSSKDFDKLAQDFDKLAQDIVRHGADKAFLMRAGSTKGADQRFPVTRFGNLLSVDRREIESYRSIRKLMREYLDRTRPRRPLSIAVFGPPGSGKSFGVKEIANTIDPEKYTALEYNLSQFASREDLVNALVVTRDTGIEGKVPLVFFDEFDSTFDSEPLGWLRYFLSLMQDGKYRFRDQELRIGPAILVFAGGTSHRYRDFAREGVIGPPLTEFQQAKGPDFVSRLRGHVDIIGPNPQTKDDQVYIIRRAITLHALLRQHHKHLVEDRDEVAVDGQVLKMLLRVPRYKHGVRSMEAILEMSTLAGADRFHKAALPSDEQLAMHLELDSETMKLATLLDK